MQYVYIVISIFCAVLADQEANSQLQEDGTVNSFLDSLKKETWDAEDKPCLDATLEILNGVKNSTLWATWIWDSIQRPTGFLYGSRYQLGSFDQCMKPPWLNSHPHLRTQYCLADVRLTDTAPKKFRAVDPNDTTDNYINTLSRYKWHFTIMTWGVCFPSRCSSNTLTKLVHAMLRTQHLPHARTKDIIMRSCQIAGDTKEYGLGLKAFMWMILLLVTVALSATQYMRYVNSDTFVTKLAKSFCLKRNWTSLMRNNKGNIAVLNGMRSTSAMLIVVLHYFAYSIIFTFNVLDIESDLDNSFKSMLLHLDIVVDTFLVISGLLLVRSIVRYKNDGKSNRRMLLLRYVRLIGPQSLMIFYVACVSVHVGDGPLWPNMSNRESEDCTVNWWINLFFVNNYVNTLNMCYPVTWYNSCDYQLAVLGTVFYYIYQRNRRLGLTSMTVGLLLLLPLPGLVTYWNNLPLLPIAITENLENWKDNFVSHGNYIQTHNRAVVYIIGMSLGHFMSVYNPADYRKIIPMKWSLPSALTALFLMERILNLGVVTWHKEFDPLVVTAFAVFNRIVWAFAICCLIVVCEYGTVPIISNYLTLQIMVPMGRLSYGVYMVHITIVFRLVNSLRLSLKYDSIQLLIGSFGVITASYLISLLIWHFVEAPLINITKVLLDIVSQKKTKEGKTKKED